MMEKMPVSPNVTAVSVRRLIFGEIKTKLVKLSRVLKLGLPEACCNIHPTKNNRTQRKTITIGSHI